jgi:methyl-accepting chemotaxis protein
MQVKKFTEAFGDINGTMQELASAGSQVLNSISALQSLSDEVQAGSTQMKEGADVITRNILSIRDFSSQVASGIDEVETGTREISVDGERHGFTALRYDAVGRPFESGGGRFRRAEARIQIPQLE